MRGLLNRLGYIIDVIAFHDFQDIDVPVSMGHLSQNLEHAHVPSDLVFARDQLAFIKEGEGDEQIRGAYDTLVGELVCDAREARSAFHHELDGPVIDPSRNAREDERLGKGGEEELQRELCIYSIFGASRYPCNIICDAIMSMNGFLFL